MATLKNPKKKLALKMLTKKDREEGKTAFDEFSPWEVRRKARADRVKRVQGEAHARAILRKENNTKKPPTKKEVKAARKIVKKVNQKKERHAKFISKKLRKQNGQ